MPLLEVNQLKKVYTTRFGGNQINALNGVSFTVEPEEYVAIMGESGSGKTTLLNILAALDRPSGGTVLLNGRDMKTIPEGELAAFRRDHLGFVFQDFNLLDTFSLEDNIYLPMVLAKKSYGEMKKKADAVVGKLGIRELMKKYPYEVSGGQKQRAAVARALVMDPAIILADEPTGALDSKSSLMLMETFHKLNTEMDSTILMVTHDAFSASWCKRILFLKDGHIFHELVRAGQDRRAFLNEILDVLALTGGELSHAD